MKKKCLRCGYVWVSTKDNPKSCPFCKSYQWNEERKDISIEFDADEREADNDKV